MSERAYTVKEINALRRAHENCYLYGRYGGPVFHEGQSGSYYSRNYKEEEKTAVVEQMVRTSMLAGHTANDLLESEK